MFAMFDDEGRISVTYEGVSGQTTADLEAIYGNNFIESANDGLINWENTWVDSGSLANRSELTATWDATTVVADGVTEIVLSGLPIPCSVVVDGDQTIVVEDGSLEFSADAIGTYAIVVDEVAYTRQEWVVNAV